MIFQKLEGSSLERTFPKGSTWYLQTTCGNIGKPNLREKCTLFKKISLVKKHENKFVIKIDKFDRNHVQKIFELKI